MADRADLVERVTESVLDHIFMDRGFARDVAEVYAERMTDDDLLEWLGEGDDDG
jgi:hypothetical protein